MSACEPGAVAIVRQQGADGLGLRRYMVILGYVGLVAVYAIAYVLSPPPDKWEDHLEQCPAQQKYCVLLDSMSYLIQCGKCVGRV